MSLKDKLGYFFIYLTHWSYTILTVTSIVMFINVLNDMRGFKRLGKMQQHLNTKLKIQWILQNLSYTTAILITIMYWVSVYKPGMAIVFISIFRFKFMTFLFIKVCFIHYNQWSTSKTSIFRRSYIHNTIGVHYVILILIFFAGITISPENVQKHIVNSLASLLDLAISATPIRLYHCYIPLLYTTVYVMFNLVYWIFGGEVSYWA